MGEICISLKYCKRAVFSYGQIHDLENRGDIFNQHPKLQNSYEVLRIDTTGRGVICGALSLNHTEEDIGV